MPLPPAPHSALHVSAVALAGLLACACGRGQTHPPGHDPTAPVASAELDDTSSAGAATVAPEACAGLDAADCGSQGARMLISPTPEDAIPLLTWACLEGHGEACGDLAAAYRVGDLPPPTEGELHGANTRGCAAKWGQSCTLLGADFVEGEVVEKDPERAAAAFALACDLGHAQGCLVVGLDALDDGDATAGLDALQQACELSTATCADAGVAVLSVLYDQPTAMAMFSAGCRGSDAGACYNLGVIYSTGQGVAVDDVEGEAWMREACTLGDQDGCEAAEELAAARDPSAVVGANLRVGSLEVNGMAIRDLQCRLDGGGVFGSMALAGALAKNKKAFDKCAPKGAAPIVRWDFGGRKTTVISVDDPAPKVAACVEAVMKKVAPGMDAQCRATLLIGAPKAAAAAADAR